jgi:hypothetical protein
MVKTTRMTHSGHWEAFNLVATDDSWAKPGVPDANADIAIAPNRQRLDRCIVVSLGKVGCCKSTALLIARSVTNVTKSIGAAIRPASTPIDAAVRYRVQVRLRGLRSPRC